MTNSEGNEPSDKPTRESDLQNKATSSRNFKSWLRSRLQRIGGTLASLAAVGAIVGGLVGYWNVWKTFRTDVLQDGQKTQREATARPDIVPRLSLVVLPFANLNNDSEQDYFADGITTDLTTDLAQMPDAFVIGRGTAFSYKNKQIDLKTLGKELSIRWAVQGAVRRSGDQVRVNVSLADIPTGQAIWSDRFDGDRTNLVAMQDQITARLARSLNIELIQAESRRIGKDQNPDAVDFSMRGWAKFYEPRSRMQTAQAKEIFDRALRLDPSNVDAMIGKASCLVVEVNNGWSTSVSEDQKAAADLADRALSKRPASAPAHVIKGDVLRYGHPEDAVREYDAALEIDAISMDGRGRFMDNIFIERLWRSIKYEEVHLKAYADGREARDGIGSWMNFYNHRRPHQAMNNQFPMAAWRAGMDRIEAAKTVDMPLRLDNANALPTYPQQTQKQQQEAA